jgi:hypothetical protein
VTFLRQRARWPVADALGWAREKLLEGLNRELGDGVRLQGGVGEVGIIGVQARVDHLLVRASGAAEATLIVDQGR